MSDFCCTLNCRSSCEHLTQIYAGFALLARKRELRLTVRKSPDYQPDNTERLEVTVGNSLRLVYDVFDGASLDEVALSKCDYYFKRSYLPERHQQHKEAHKLRPLGLNYPVYATGDFACRRCFWAWLTDKSNGHRDAILLTARNCRLLGDLFLRSNGRHTCSLRTLEAIPRNSAEPFVLFLTRLWNPEGCLRQDLKLEREKINTMRVNCIRGLRREFGRRFVGGVEPTDFAIREFPECVADSRMTLKREYLRTVKMASVCINTLGLRQSNPWKLGEYVAMSRAIVSEPLVHTVPGDFDPGKNYLEFDTVDGCLEHATRLMENSQQRYEMMLDNHAYYHSFLRPDMLIWNTLQVVIAKSGKLASLANHDL
jgi:hypothetical protein